MDKRYQIFISSTFEDLKDERQSVLKAILELNHMPAGMELFPASDEEAWSLIKDVIDASDYYVLIIGGRYGSLDEQGIGFTENEYDYAVSTDKPVVAFLHKNPNNLPREKTETDVDAWNRLVEFRAKVEKKHTCIYWKNAEELKSKVIVSLTSIFKRKPRAGWVKADNLPSLEIFSELAELRKKNYELEKKINRGTLAPPKGIENLQQGDDECEINCLFTADIKVVGFDYNYESFNYNGSFNITWNSLWSAISPIFIDESTETNFTKKIDEFLTFEAVNAFKQTKELENSDIRRMRIEKGIHDTIKIQFRALGLIMPNKKTRSVHDRNSYWTLTDYGDELMMKMRALKKGGEKNEIKISEIKMSKN